MIRHDEFLKLLKQYDATTLCFECELLRTPRSRHCYQCGRCIDIFDHHCPWINNCIGKGNYWSFYFFVVVQLIYICLVSWNLLLDLFVSPKVNFETKCYKDEKTSKFLCKNNVNFSLLYGSSLFMLGVAVFFMLSLLTLVILQTTNILTGLTTAERYGRSRPRPGPSLYDDL